MVRWIRQLVPRRRWARRGLVILLLLGATWFIAPKLAAPYVQRKLQEMIATRLNAELRMDSLAYLPPFGVRIRDAELIAHREGNADVQLLSVARIDLRLAKLPFGEGPLVIERIDVQEPVVHLILTEQGLVGRAPSAPPAPAPAGPPAPPGPAGPVKVSDMFRLEHLAMWGGRLVLEDQTRPGSVPMVWSGLSASTKTTATSSSSYSFQFNANHPGVAAMNADGAFDLDSQQLSVSRSDLTVKTDSSQTTSGLPAQIQSLIRAYRVDGQVSVLGSLDLSLHNPATAMFDATIRVNQASALFPKTNAALDDLKLALHVRTVPPTAIAEDALAGPLPATTQPAFSAIEVRVEEMTARSGGAHLSIGDVAPASQPVFRLDPVSGVWAVSDFQGDLRYEERAVAWAGQATSSRLHRPGLMESLNLGGRVDFAGSGKGVLTPTAGRSALANTDYRVEFRPRDLRLQPPTFPIPLENIGGENAAIELRPGVVVVKDIRATYGGDVIELNRARLPIPDDPLHLRQSFSLEEIAGRWTFHQPGPVYPEKFNKLTASLRPAGAFEVGGGSYVRIERNENPPPHAPAKKYRVSDWFVSVSTDAGAIAFAENKLPFTHIVGDATITNGLVDLTRFEGSLFGGKATAAGKVTAKSPFVVEDGRLALREIDLARMAHAFNPENTGEQLVGRGFLNLTLAGALGDSNPPISDALLNGSGEFEIIQGHFWTLPVLGDIASRSKGSGALALGEAAGVFRVEGRSILLDNAAISSPALGLIGSGSVGFDQTLKLEIVAAPLGDWQDRVQQTRIPIVSDIASEVVGGVQRILTAATRVLLYQFRVTGTTSAPEVQTVPTPVLTDPAALLFGKMLGEAREHHLLESIKPNAKKAPPAEQRKNGPFER